MGRVKQILRGLKSQEQWTTNLFGESATATISEGTTGPSKGYIKWLNLSVSERLCGSMRSPLHLFSFFWGCVDTGTPHLSGASPKAEYRRMPCGSVQRSDLREWRSKKARTSWTAGSGQQAVQVLGGPDPQFWIWFKGHIMLYISILCQNPARDGRVFGTAPLEPLTKNRKVFRTWKWVLFVIVCERYEHKNREREREHAPILCQELKGCHF